MITKHLRSGYLFCSLLLLIVHFDKTFGKSHSHGHHGSHSSHSSHSSHDHHGSHSSPSSHSSHDHHGSHSSISSHLSHDHHTNNHDNSHPHGDHSNSNTRPIGWDVGNHDHPSSIGNHPGQHGYHDPYQNTHPPHDPAYPAVHPSDPTGHYPPYHPPSPGNSHYNGHPYPSEVIVIDNPVTSRNKVRIIHHHHYHHRHDPHRQNYNNRNAQVLPENKVLVPEQFLPSPTTQCGMTLCSDVVNYPLKEINDVVNRARQKFSSGLMPASFRIKGISLQNFTSKYDSFWYGKEAPDHRFVDTTSSCREHVNTVYPREGYSSNDKSTYYVVNIPSLRQGLTNIECESSYQMCSKADVPASESRICRQMYREEQLLVLPSNKRIFNVEHFELKTFHVPTGCACIAST